MARHSSGKSMCSFHVQLRVSFVCTSIFNGALKYIYMQVGVGPFVMDRSNSLSTSSGSATPSMRGSDNGNSSAPRSGTVWARAVTPRGLQLAIDVILIAVKLSHLYQLTEVVDLSLLLLAEFAGVVKVSCLYCSLSLCVLMNLFLLFSFFFFL